MTAWFIDWDNIPDCPEPGQLVVSPYICIDHGYVPPVGLPHANVPVPGTAALLVMGWVMMRVVGGKRRGIGAGRALQETTK